jgi:hypothetical protein
MYLRQIMCIALLATILVPAWGHMVNDPYNPETDRAKIAAELEISETEILLDSRCAFSNTKEWIPAAPLELFQTCTIILTPAYLILATYDATTERHLASIRLPYTDLRNVALRVDPASQNSNARSDGKKRQLQLKTPNAFLSVSVYSGKMGDHSSDTRGAEEAFEIIRSKGVAVVESPGRVELQMPRTQGFFRFK